MGLLNCAVIKPSLIDINECSISQYGAVLTGAFVSGPDGVGCECVSCCSV